MAISVKESKDRISMHGQATSLQLQLLRHNHRRAWKIDQNVNEKIGKAGRLYKYPRNTFVDEKEVSKEIRT